MDGYCETFRKLHNIQPIMIPVIRNQHLLVMLIRLLAITINYSQIF